MTFCCKNTATHITPALPYPSMGEDICWDYTLEYVHLPANSLATRTNQYCQLTCGSHLIFWWYFWPVNLSQVVTLFFRDSFSHFLGVDAAFSSVPKRSTCGWSLEYGVQCSPAHQSVILLPLSCRAWWSWFVCQDDLSRWIIFHTPGTETLSTVPRVWKKELLRPFHALLYCF